MACYANYYNPTLVEFGESPCSGFTANLQVDRREILCGLVSGVVTCALNNSPVQYPLIVATNTTTGEVFYAIGNINGLYQILLDPDYDYNIAAYCSGCYATSASICC